MDESNQTGYRNIRGKIMLENNLKELGTMLVKAGNTIERQKEEIERLRRENDILKNRRNVVTIEELKNEISEAMEAALKYSKKVKDKNDITDILNVQYLMGKYHAYELLMYDLDFKTFAELHKKYNRAWNECQYVIGKLYH